MRKFLFLIALFTLLGGANSYAVKLYATYETPAPNGSWNGTTKTYTWIGNTNNLMTMFTFPSGELSMYTKIHLEVAQVTHHNFRFCLMNGGTKLGEVVCWSSGTKDITFSVHEGTKNVDLSQVTHIAFGGAEDPGEGNSYSCVLTNVYIEGPATGYEAEYTEGTPLSLESVVSGNTLVTIGGTDGSMLYGTTNDNQIYSAAINTAMGNVSTAGGNNSTYKFRILEATDDGLIYPEGIEHLYRIKAYKDDGINPYTGPGWNGASSFFLQDIGWTYNVAEGTSEADASFYSITPIGGKENTYKISSYKFGGVQVHENIYSKSEWVFYVLGETIVPEKRVVAANDEIFAMSNFSAGKWTFAEPVSLYDWNYLVIATENTAANASHEIILTDNNGKTVRGNDYNGEAVGTGAGMWLDRWNSQNIIAIDLNQLRRANGLDVFHITQLEITGDIQPSVVYLTDYANTKLTNRGRWTLYVEGDVNREYSANGKFGTICLPYKASYAGCEVYSIADKSEDGISLTKVYGLLEPGTPYFYMSSDVNGHDNGGTELDVNFFRADFDTYDAAEPVENNGLIGTFSEITAPADTKYLILSNNTLYNTEDATGDDAITIGANKAYIDKSKISSGSVDARGVKLFFGDAEITGIKEVVSAQRKDGKFYDMMGREVTRPVKGRIYIYNGLKITFN